MPTGTEIEVQVINGEDFAGAKLAYFPNRVTRFEILQNGETIKVGDRAGDVPALVHNAQDAGLMIIAYETKPSRITYKEWEKFTKFAEHKDFGDDIGARHDATGAPREGFAEAYTRHAKALVAIGHGQGADQQMGLTTEIVALTNPYASDFDKQMRVQVLYQGKPRQNAQVEVFERDADGNVTVDASARTDADGIAVVSVNAGHDYLFDAVVLRPNLGSTDAVWDSLWAALTFSVPN